MNTSWHIKEELAERDKKIEKLTKENKKIKEEYEEIIKIWKKEWMNDKNNPQYDDERKLLSRI